MSAFPGIHFCMGSLEGKKEREKKTKLKEWKKEKENPVESMPNFRWISLRSRIHRKKPIFLKLAQ